MIEISYNIKKFIRLLCIRTLSNVYLATTLIVNILVSQKRR